MRFPVIFGFGLALATVGCSSEPAKVKHSFRVVSESGSPMAGVGVTYLSKDNKHAEMSESGEGGNGTINLYPNVYGVGVSKYEGGRSAQSLRPGSKEFEDAKASGQGNIPPQNILPAKLEDPKSSGIEVTVKPGMDKAFDIVVKGVGDFKNPEKTKGAMILKGGPPGSGGGKGKEKGEAGPKAGDDNAAKEKTK